MSIAGLPPRRSRAAGPGPGAWAPVTLVAMTALALAAAPAWAGDFEFSAQAGAVASGALFDAAASTSRPWWIGNGQVEALELTAEVDESLLGGVRVGIGLTPQLTLQASASASQLDITAQALSAGARIVTFHEYDQMTAVMFDLVLVGRLSKSPSHPYVVAGGGFTLLSFQAMEALDQSQPGITLGAGYRWALESTFSLDLDVRDLMTWVDTDDEPNRPAVTSFEGAAPLHLWQFTVGASFKL